MKEANRRSEERARLIRWHPTRVKARGGRRPKSEVRPRRTQTESSGCLSAFHRNSLYRFLVSGLRFPLGFILAAGAIFALGCGEAAKKPGPVRSSLNQYVEQARAIGAEDRQAEGSLWIDTGNRSDPFRDLKAYRVGDIVTIAVRESTSAVSQATTDSTKTADFSSGATGLFGLEKGISELSGLVDASRDSEFQGEARTTRSNVLTTSVTARVVEAFPNGNLLLEGNREVLINGERQIVTVRGVIRPSDISPTNVVASTSLAEMEIQVEGRGIVSRAQKPGILYKILSGFWPF